MYFQFSVCKFCSNLMYYLSGVTCDNHFYIYANRNLKKTFKTAPGCRKPMLTKNLNCQSIQDVLYFVHRFMGTACVTTTPKVLTVNSVRISTMTCRGDQPRDATPMPAKVSPCWSLLVCSALVCAHYPCSQLPAHSYQSPLVFPTFFQFLCFWLFLTTGLLLGHSGSLWSLSSCV